MSPGGDKPGDFPVPYPRLRLQRSPTILKIFRQNLRLPVRALQALDQPPPPAEIALACAAILKYLETENPYLLSYRFGPKQAEEMRLALADLQALAEQAMRSNVRLQITPIRLYSDLETGNEVSQTTQGFMERWM